MRKLLCLLLVTAALVGAGGARADIGPPVHVRILGEPRAAEPGVPFKGQLQITTDLPLVLEDLLFVESDGWDQLALDAGPQMSVDKARPTVVDFEVVTSDPSQPLQLSFTVDGFPVTRSFDLSPEMIAFVRGPNAVAKVRDETDVPSLGDDAQARPEPTLSAEGVAPQDPAKGRNIRVHGRFVYVRSDGWTIGADGMTVRVYDNDSPFGSAELAVVATDAQGWYDVTFWWGDDFFDPQPDIYVRFETTNTRVQTESPAFASGPYAWDTATTNDYGGTDLNYGTLQPADINQHPAVHIHTNLVRTWRWWLGYGYDTPFVRANWPNGASGAFYNGEIYFSTGEQWSEATGTHEYGHHWVQIYALSPAPSYCNGVCDTDGCGHCLWCAETANVAFTEGFPDWMGDVIPKTYASAYGRAALSSYDFETVLVCNNASYRDPLMIEGNLAAVVRDIGDGTNDDDFYPEVDELSLGWGPAITTVDLDHPTTATGFLDAFKARYPGYREGLWATAKNCNYELDVSAPPAVTGLYSTSHSTSVSSPDPTIDLTWTRAVDDCSGVRGYGVMIAGGIGLPSAVQNIGDVTSFTTSSLAPGTYYFSIRTLDRSGKWSGTYAWNGPYVVRAPVPANLAYYGYSGWSSVVVPRGTADANFGSVPAPTSLAGNSDATWWNVGLWNSGESSTEGGFQVRAYVDSDWYWWVSWGAIGSGGGAYAVNQGPLNIRGGRHTFEAKLDAVDEVAETNEGDNRWAHQWVWSPLPLTADTPIVRAAPPLRTAGWDAVTDGSALYVNSDGLRMGGSSWWDATVLRPLSGTADHDLSLHAASTGASDGFATTLAGSAAGSGAIDAVIVNHNTVGWGSSYDVGVTNWDGEMANYEVVHATNSYISYGDSITVPFNENQMLRIWEFYVAPENVGAVSITVDVDPAQGPLYAQWLDNTFQTGGLYNYSAWSYTDAVTGRARLDLNIAASGYHGLLVYRQPDWSKGTGAIDVTIEFDRTPPDFLPPYVAGWYAPIVPRDAFDGTGSSAPAPATLPGNVASTYLNMAVRNNSVSDSPAGLPGHIYIDGGYSAWVAWGAFPGAYETTFNWNYPFAFSGGRHTLAWKLDADNAIEEMYETNNNYSEQWVWTPLDLVNFTPVVRAMPASQYGGWTELSTGETFYPNCDGLRMPNVGGYWRAVAVMPGADSDVDLRLHQPSTGAKNGFAENLAGSYWGGDWSDYVLVNFNLTGYQSYDVGTVNYSGYNNYTTESTASGGWISFPDGIYGPYDLAADRILNLQEVYLPAGQTGIHLMNLTGDVDWGLSLHGSGSVYQGKSDVLATTYFAPGGGNELLVVDVPTEGYYCIAVWKTTSAELAKAGTYNLLIRPMWASGVDDGLPTVTNTALVEITPNPFNPQTKITYDLAREGRVQLEIYDLQGHLVRTLVDGARGTGRHTENWNGTNDAGGKVASGLYMARLTAGGVAQMMKMTLLK